MLNKRIIIITSVLSFVVIAITFILFKPKQQVSEEAQTHLDNLFSLSGKLTSEEKQVYFENAFALKKLSVQFGQMPEKEMDEIQDHIQKLIIENPDLILSPQEYDQRFGHIIGHTHGHPHGEDLHQETQNALDKVNTAIAELDASNLSDGVKESLLSILNLRRAVLSVSKSEFDELKEVYIAFLKNDPEVSGVMKDPRTGEYIPDYPNMLRVYRRRTHHPDGTVDDVVTGISRSADTPENLAALKAYETALEKTSSLETQPAPPEIEGLRFSIEYEDVYLNPEEAGITDKTEQPVEAVPAPPTLSDAPTAKEEEPEEEEVWTEIADDVFSLQESLRDVHDLQMQREITIFLQEALGVPFDQFLEMSDADIEDELRRIFASTDADIEATLQDMFGVQQSSLSDITKFESNLKKDLRNRFSSMRINRAIATINQLGPKEGLQRLKEVDPEISKKVEDYLQIQKEEN